MMKSDSMQKTRESCVLDNEICPNTNPLLEPIKPQTIYDLLNDWNPDLIFILGFFLIILLLCGIESFLFRKKLTGNDYIDDDINSDLNVRQSTTDLMGSSDLTDKINSDSFSDFSKEKTEQDLRVNEKSLSSTSSSTESENSTEESENIES